MKALKIIGYILAGIIALVLIAMVILTFPNGDPNSSLDYIIVMLATSWIFAIVSLVPFVIGVVGTIISLVKRQKGFWHFIIIALAPLTLTGMYLLSGFLI